VNIFLTGGETLLGSAAAEELTRRGHQIETDSFAGCEGFVFAAGLDMAELERRLRLAKESGVKNAVICGSYFCWLDKKWPKLELTRWHPYIRSHVEQEKMALSFADENFNVAVLELPCVFGTKNGIEPVWTVLVKELREMKGVTMYTKGGTAMITKKQAAQAIAGALEKTEGAKSWPIGYYNMPWNEFLQLVQANMGLVGRKVITVPNWLFNVGIRTTGRENIIERGICLAKLSDLLSADCYVDKLHGSFTLGVEDDDIEKEISQTIRLSVDCLDGKVSHHD
jgi:nucleoside-diphosphate-sugar epimerase